MKIIFVISSFLFLTSCANIELSASGGKVQIVQQISISDLKNYQAVGDISCDFGANAKSTTTNIKQCRVDLKNKAAELGAQIIVIEHQRLGTNQSFGIGQSSISGCGNCISMVGTAYRSLEYSSQ